MMLMILILISLEIIYLCQEAITHLALNLLVKRACDELDPSQPHFEKYFFANIKTNNNNNKSILIFMFFSRTFTSKPFDHYSVMINSK